MIDREERGSPVETGGDSASTREERLHQVIAQFLDAVAAGDAPDRQQLLADHSELADDLQEFFDNNDRLRQIAVPWFSDAAAPSQQEVDSPGATPCGSDLPTIAYDGRGAIRTTAASPLSEQQPQGERFGDYELLEEIGRGGMGIVYRARQVSLNRIVAVKTILGDRLSTGADAERLRAEAESVAGLQHPGIVKTHEVGEHAGRHYFSMEYVESRTLFALIREALLSSKRAAEYARQIAEAIGHAHQNQIWHRDLKPSNILIDRNDRVRVADFGLAKRVQSDANLTMSGQIVGTPAYMAPEQAGAKRGKIGPRSDVYSVGAMLYEMLTGRPPFQADNRLEILMEVQQDDPVLPRRLNPQIPRDLEMICLKCLEKNPQHRYLSARELADDLDRFLNGDSISISSLRLFDRLVRTLERGHHDVEFRTWARMLFHFVWIIFLAHFGVFLIRVVAHDDLSILMHGVRFLEFSAMGLVFWSYRRDWYPPRGGPSRQLWTLWLGYVAGSIVLATAGRLMAAQDRPFDEMMLYPQLAVLAGIGFIMMGGSYWGYCYAMGAAFLTLALLMSLNLMLAPLMFGLVWGACLAAWALHLRKLAEER